MDVFSKLPLQGTKLTLSEEVLGLHQGIRTVLITKEEDADWMMIEEAIRPGITLLENSREEARAQLKIAPAILIGAADAIKGKAGPVQIVAVVYENISALFAALDSPIHQMLCLTVERDASEEVMQVLRRALPKLKK